MTRHGRGGRSLGDRRPRRACGGRSSRAAAAAIVIAPATAALTGCGGWQSALTPRSPGAAEIATLWWIMFTVTGVLSALVITILLYAVYRARRAAAAESGEELADGERRFILLAGAAFPAVVLLVFVVLSVRTGSAVVLPPGEPRLAVEVVGHKFWWEIRYPGHGVTTANEIRIPAGVPVEVRVTSADVIHSFWVPKLSPGKVDMNPGRTNRIWMLAEEPGWYRGQCTEFCGVQHALMAVLVIAEEPAAFESWLAARRLPPPEPVDAAAARGREVFFQADCAQCHVIRGVNEPRYVGQPGPELTDLAARHTLGALTLPNRRGTLAGWILDPHQFKPGVRMPATDLSGPDIRALLAYLETLR